MAAGFWKVGELAKQSGVSVRTLHYYDEIGLLSPSYRTDSGHRLYAGGDVVRLQQIRSLRQLDLSLEDIRAMLSRADASPLAVIRSHLERLTERIDAQQRLRDRLEAIAARLDVGEDVALDEFLLTIKEIEMVEKTANYFTPEQREKLAERRAEVGEDRIRDVEGEWKELLEQLHAAMDSGVDPTSAPAQRLARWYAGLIEEFTGGDAEITKSLRTMYQQEPDIAAEHGYRPDPKMTEFIGRALRSIADEA